MPRARQGPGAAGGLPLAAAPAAQTAPEPLPDRVPEASARTREQKRMDRLDKDRDGTVTRDEYLALRRKAFARLDLDHNGQLSFDEWAAKSEAKFAAADADHSGGMNAAEFATTAVKRKPSRARPRADCPRPASGRQGASDPASGDDEG